MMKKYRDYIILLGVFLIVIFSSNIEGILSYFNNDINGNDFKEAYWASINKDYEELLEVVDLSIPDRNLEVSKVYLRDIYSFKDEVTIYKGSNEGFSEGMAVINNSGLVGVISNVRDNSSIVRLISNKKSNISVRIGNSYGILKWQDDGLVVSDLQVYDEVAIGDKIYTSGVGNLPGEIYVGSVRDISINETGIEKILVVDSGVDLSKINYVLVVK